MSRDEQSMLVVSYAELKHCLEQSFHEILNAAPVKTKDLLDVVVDDKNMYIKCNTISNETSEKSPSSSSLNLK